MENPHSSARSSATWNALVVESVFRIAPCGILVVAMDGEICIAANDSMVRLGLTREAAAGQSLEQVALPGVVSCVRDMLEECRITHEPHNVEQIIEVGGKETWWLVSGSPVHDDGGRWQHVVCTFFYIDFLKRTEDALRQSEETFRTLIERVPDAVLVTDRSGVRYVNPAAVALLGTTQSDLVGRSPARLLDRSGWKNVRQAWRSASSGRKLVEARAIKSDGTLVPVEFVPIPVVFEGRASVLVVARNVTERNELYTRLANADRTIALGTLAAGVAHEINSPLTFVQTNISLVLERLAELNDPDGDIRQAMVEALDGVRRVAKTVRDLGDLARGDENAIANVDVREVINQVVKLAHLEVSRRSKLTLTHCDVGMVRASPLVAHVFLNLVLNAVQAIPQGDPTRHEVRISSSVRDEFVVVEVSDTGVGIAPEHLARVFDPFFTTKPLGQGTGLGLALAQRIVQASGGRIVARSGKGATFEVWLPRA